VSARGFRWAVVVALAIGIGLASQPGRPLIGAGLGAMVAALALLLERLGTRAAMPRLVWGTAGALGGLLIGALVGYALHAAAIASLGSSLLLLSVALGGYVGASIGVRRAGELTGVNALLFPPTLSGRAMKLVDTSAIIDGRIADLAATGFVEGPLVVPGFVLRELQQIADSGDPRKRTRGKRGFEIVQRLRQLPGAALEVRELDIPGVDDVDGKLVALARSRGAKLVTTDYNLNKLADVSGVAVLNVNEVANAVKSALVAGEATRVHVAREGKETGQGLAYLDDGTMVVVEQGKRWIGHTVDVVVTSVLQTPSGRIVFTRLRGDESGHA
jgi:uncharacterized protein YacL